MWPCWSWTSTNGPNKTSENMNWETRAERSERSNWLRRWCPASPEIGTTGRPRRSSRNRGFACSRHFAKGDINSKPLGNPFDHWPCSAASSAANTTANRAGSPSGKASKNSSSASAVQILCAKNVVRTRAHALGDLLPPLPGLFKHALSEGASISQTRPSILLRLSNEKPGIETLPIPGWPFCGR